MIPDKDYNHSPSSRVKFKTLSEFSVTGFSIGVDLFATPKIYSIINREEVFDFAFRF
jgi:hypothetical protein